MKHLTELNAKISYNFLKRRHQSHEFKSILKENLEMENLSNERAEFSTNRFVYGKKRDNLWMNLMRKPVTTGKNTGRGDEGQILPRPSQRRKFRNINKYPKELSKTQRLRSKAGRLFLIRRRSFDIGYIPNSNKLFAGKIKRRR